MSILSLVVFLSFLLCAFELLYLTPRERLQRVGPMLFGLAGTVGACAALFLVGGQACTPAQDATSQKVLSAIDGVACSPLDPLDNISAVRFACELEPTAAAVVSDVQSLTVTVPTENAKAFAAKHSKDASAPLDSSPPDVTAGG
jgi:hypothetical protein